jgi:hypothetical protein
VIENVDPYGTVRFSNVSAARIAADDNTAAIDLQ